MDEDTETLRRILSAYYRRGHPWREEPTLASAHAALAAGLRGGHLELLDALAARLGPGTELKALRLSHLLALG